MVRVSIHAVLQYIIASFFLILNVFFILKIFWWWFIPNSIYVFFPNCILAQTEYNMALIPAGKLMINSKYDGKEVFIDNFFMDRFEVSQESYEKIININPSFFVVRNDPLKK